MNNSAIQSLIIRLILVMIFWVETNSQNRKQQNMLDRRASLLANKNLVAKIPIKQLLSRTRNIVEFGRLVREDHAVKNRKNP